VFACKCGGKTVASSPLVGKGKSRSSLTAQRTAGFTLLEVLIAFIITALALAALMRASVSGLSATRVATRYEEAVARARSHLTAVTHGAMLVPGDNQGDDGGFHWRVRVTPIATITSQPLSPLRQSNVPTTLYAVSVWIIWRDGGTSREVRLDTEQIGRAGR
jgi:general secretion pathway protein I